MTKTEFLKRIQGKHPEGRYDYSLLPDEFNTRKEKLTFVCNKHGPFEQRPSGHLSGYGCKECGLESIALQHAHTLEEFVKKARAIHGDFYDYSKVVYKNIKTKVEIVCPKHGSFFPTPEGHTNGKPTGCPTCGKAKQTGAPTLSQEEFLRRAEKVHGDYYDYTESVYAGMHIPIVIHCPKHGRFTQRPNNHLKKGCGQCGWDKRVDSRTLTTEDFVARSRIVHGLWYSYDTSDYKSAREDVVITCPKHGEFSQNPYEHMRGARCPRCTKVVSSQHDIILQWLEEMGVEYRYNDRTIIYPKEVDVYIPSHNLAIEVHGEWWHRHANLGDRTYHFNKFKECGDKDIRLLQFWAVGNISDKPTITKSIISNLLGMSEHRIFARGTKVVDVTPKQYREFLDENHLEGGKNSSIRKGLSHRGELVSVIGFSRNKDGWELDRFASRTFTNVIGGFSRLMKYAAPKGIITSYSYNHYSRGDLYKNYGFTMTRENKYSLFYLHEGKLKNRNNFMRYKCIEMLGLKKDDPRTEKELALLLGAEQVFSAGTRTWVLDNT